MKIKHFLVFVLFLFLALPSKMSALCTTAQQADLQKIANNITYSYEYIESNDTFNITLTNLDNRIYVKEDSKNKIYRNVKNKEITLGGYRSGDTITFSVYDPSYCVHSSLKIIYINLPLKNKYHNTELCKDISDFYYCNKWTQNNLTKKQMQEKVNEYKGINDTEDDQNVLEARNYFLEKLIEIYINYYFIILPTIIVVCIFGMYKSYKKNKL